MPQSESANPIANRPVIRQLGWINRYNSLSQEDQLAWDIALGNLPEGTSLADLPNLDDGSLPVGSKLASGHTDPLTGSWIPAGCSPINENDDSRNFYPDPAERLAIAKENARDLERSQ